MAEAAEGSARLCLLLGFPLHRPSNIVPSPLRFSLAVSADGERANERADGRTGGRAGASSAGLV